MKFNRMIVEDVKVNKPGRYVKVKCSVCQAIRITRLSEHKRTCQRQSEKFNQYHCSKCSRKSAVSRAIASKSADHLKSDHWRQQCREKSKALWLDESYREKCQRLSSDWTKEQKQKVSDSVKKLFEDPIYIAKIKKARKGYWQDDSYRRKQRENYDRGLRKFWEENRDGIVSRLQKILYSLLDDLRVSYKSEFKVGPYHFDCFVPDHNLLIECNGEYWHKLPDHVRNDQSKSTYVSRYFPQYRQITFWEEDFLNPKVVRDAVSSALGIDQSPIQFQFIDLDLKSIGNQEAVQFISKHHYTYSIGHGRSQLRYGAYLGQELIAVCCFANPTRSESATRLGLDSHTCKELTRFCIHPRFHKRNFGSWFLSRCCKWLKQVKPAVEGLISFSDSTFGHQGTIYKASNWILDGEVKPDYWYVRPDGYPIHKKTVYNHARKMSMKESDYADQQGYLKRKGKKKLRFVYRYEN